MSKATHGIDGLMIIPYNTQIHTHKPIIINRKIENVIELFDKRTMLLLNEISSF